MIKLTQMNHYYDFSLYKKNTYELQPGVLFLIGHNGAGKSTFLYLLEQACKKEKINYVFIREDVDRGHMSFDKYLYSDNLKDLANYTCSSEGQRIYFNFGKHAEKIGNLIGRSAPGSKIAILLDGIDSGLDCYYLKQIKDFVHFVEKDCEKNKLEAYIVVTANKFSFCRNENCLDVQRLEPITFSEYDDFEKFICDRYEEEKTHPYNKPNKESIKKETLHGDNDGDEFSGVFNRRTKDLELHTREH